MTPEQANEIIKYLSNLQNGLIIANIGIFTAVIQITIHIWTSGR
jgi:hypothetical protein